MKKILLLFLAFVTISTTRADEGMWMVNMLESLQNKMKSYGCNLDAKIIYDENMPSLYNAVVALDFGCTGSMISNDGLMITNHHCAYDDIHASSTDENNYLEKGFWAKNRNEEIPIKGKSVFFLRKVIDITEEMQNYLDSCKDAGKPVSAMGMRRVTGIFETKYSKGTTYQAMCHNVYRGVKWYVFLYDQFKDVRLVGAPPVSIGAFGGETDNFKYPQHKGDFALYRVYGDKNGKPAEYSGDNIPIKPVKILTISEKGFSENDFAMTMGYPASTYRYIPSVGINEKVVALNPVQQSVKRAVLDAMKPWMDADTTIRLKYANKYFSIANSQVLRKGELISLTRFDVVNKKRAEENEMQKWIDKDAKRKTEYGSLLSDLHKAYSSTLELNKAKTYFQESIIRGSAIINLVNRYKTVMNAAIKKDSNAILRPDSDEVKQMIKNVQTLYKDYDENVERDILAVVLKYYINNVPQKYWSEESVEVLTKFNGNAKLIADYVFDNSIFRNEETFVQAFAQSVPANKYINDPACRLNKSASVVPFNEDEEKLLNGLEPYKLRTIYAKALYEFRQSQNKLQAPDANSTMRLSYGRVGGIKPADAVQYAAQTTSQGYFDKADPTDYEFNFNPRLKTLFEKKDFGRWGENGVLYINFLTDNDITGGNSGSPVLNADGNLIGLAFDGNWESLAGDVHYENDYNKSVCVDIRYVMWIIEKYADAGYLLNEMKFIK